MMKTNILLKNLPEDQIKFFELIEQKRNCNINRTRLNKTIFKNSKILNQPIKENSKTIKRNNDNSISNNFKVDSNLNNNHSTKLRQDNIEYDHYRKPVCLQTDSLTNMRLAAKNRSKCDPDSLVSQNKMETSADLATAKPGLKVPGRMSWSGVSRCYRRSVNTMVAGAVVAVALFGVGKSCWIESFVDCFIFSNLNYQISALMTRS